MEYKPLEKNSLESFGGRVPTITEGSASLFATTSFVYTLLLSAVVVAAFYRYVLAGAIRMQASEHAIRESNEIIKRVTLGLLGVFSLFLILFTVNKDLITGDVGLGGLRAAAVLGGGTRSNGGAVLSQTNSNSNQASASCESAQAVISRLQPGAGGVCAGVSCTVLSGCNYQQYLPIIDSAVNGDTQLRKMIIATMCKESRARPNAKNQNSNGTYDCGLMQINQPGSCENNPSQPSIENNIRQGVTLMRQKISGAAQVYPGIPREAGAFSSYNCCSNGTIPNSASADCTQANGFPFTLPKWACPINPGTSASNMCTVKNYTCELIACMGQL